jgi:hypothetical protein
MELRQQGQHVGRIRRDLVKRWVSQPIAFTAAHNVANHPNALARLARAELPRKDIKIPTLS